MPHGLPIEIVRMWNARFLADREGGLTRFADRIERSPSQVSQLIGKTQIKTIERKLARHFEQMCKMPEGWLDSPHIDD